MLIEVKNLSFSYHNKPVLHQLNFNLDHKQKCLISGENGSGKSTFLTLLAGLLKPSSGTITYPDSRTRNFMAFCPQKIVTSSMPFSLYDYLLSATAWDRGPAKQRKELILYHLQQFNLFEYRNKIYYELSGGQQQRASLCRALIQQATVILFDEPTAALDQQSKEEFIISLSHLDQAVVMVTHEQFPSLNWPGYHLKQGSLCFCH